MQMASFTSFAKISVRDAVVSDVITAETKRQIECDDCVYAILRPFGVVQIV